VSVLVFAVVLILVALLVAFLAQRFMGEPYGIVAFIVIILIGLLVAFGGDTIESFIGAR
jgi:CDP-diglyceride synthetase